MFNVSFQASACADWAQCPNSNFTGVIFPGSSVITIEYISGNVKFYAINQGKYSVSIPGITTETKTFYFDPIIPTSQGYTQQITPQS